MPSPLPQETPFAELRHAVQAGANEITWQKRTPISNNERNHAMRLKKLFAYTLPIPLLLTILVYFIDPMLFFDKGTLFLPTVLLFGCYNIISPLFTLWLTKRYNRVLDLPTNTPQPATYYVRFKGSRDNTKGLTVVRGVALRLDYTTFTQRDWQAVLPTAAPDEVQQLSQMIIQRLNNQ